MVEPLPADTECVRQEHRWQELSLNSSIIIIIIIMVMVFFIILDVVLCRNSFVLGEDDEDWSF